MLLERKKSLDYEYDVLKNTTGGIFYVKEKLTKWSERTSSF